MRPVEFSELESVSVCLWDEIQTVRKSVEAIKSGGCGCSCDFASIRAEFAKMHGIIKWGFLVLFINIKWVNDLLLPRKVILSFVNYNVRIGKFIIFALSNNPKNIWNLLLSFNNAFNLKKICKISLLPLKKRFQYKMS